MIAGGLAKTMNRAGPATPPHAFHSGRTVCSLDSAYRQNGVAGDRASVMLATIMPR
jgi:hypothetical protein